MRRILVVVLCLVVLPAIFTGSARSAEIGHFTPGIANIRDFALPAPGYYGVVYNYGYFTNRLNDANGNKISSITIGGIIGPGITFDVDLNVSAYALAPAFIWAPNKKVLGGITACIFHRHS